MKSYNQRRKEWLDAMVVKGHDPFMNEGELDAFIVDFDHHNGPGCKKCHWSCCWHCKSIDDIPECTK